MIDSALQQRIDAYKSESNPLKQAKMVAEIRETSVISNRQLAELLGVKPSHLSQLIRVLKLPEILVDGFLSKQISFTHLVIISRLKTHDDQVALYEEVLSRTMSIAQTEQRVRELLHQVNSDGEYVSPDDMKLFADRISKSLGGARVQVVQTRIKCKIVIEQSGNLEETSKFLENTASRFRRRQKFSHFGDGESSDEFHIEPLHANLRKKEVEQPIQPRALPESCEIQEPPPIAESSPKPFSPWGKLAYEKYTLSNATPLDTEDLSTDASNEEPPLR